MGTSGSRGGANLVGDVASSREPSTRRRARGRGPAGCYWLNCSLFPHSHSHSHSHSKASGEERASDLWGRGGVGGDIPFCVTLLTPAAPPAIFPQQPDAALHGTARCEGLLQWHGQTQTQITPPSGHARARQFGSYQRVMGGLFSSLCERHIEPGPGAVCRGVRAQGDAPYGVQVDTAQRAPCLLYSAQWREPVFPLRQIRGARRPAGSGERGQRSMSACQRR